MKDKRVLVDTSVWIDYLKNTVSAVHKKLDEIMTSRDLYVPKVVIAELIQGAKSEKEISMIQEFLDAFTIIDNREETWIKAGNLSFSMKKKGETIGLIDCYIAVMAEENGCAVFSLDEHFQRIRKFLKFELIALDS